MGVLIYAFLCDGNKRGVGMGCFAVETILQFLFTELWNTVTSSFKFEVSFLIYFLTHKRTAQQNYSSRSLCFSFRTIPVTELSICFLQKSQVIFGNPRRSFNTWTQKCQSVGEGGRDFPRELQVPRNSTVRWSHIDIVAKPWYYNFHICYMITMWPQKRFPIHSRL